MNRIIVAAGVAGCLVLQAWGRSADAPQDLSEWKLGDDKTPEAFEERVRNTPPDQRGAIEDELIRIAGSPDATPESRRYSCRMLQRIGTKKCVPVLGRLLVDRDFSHFARLALERMTECPEAGQALRDALEKGADPLKVGLIASLGERREAGAIPALQGFTRHADPQVASAAFLALGKMGSEDALKFLKGEKAEGPVESARLDALLTCAGFFDGRQAADVYDTVYREGKVDVHRAGALLGLLRTDGEKATALIMDLMKGGDSYLRRVAVGCVANVKSPELTKAVASSLKDLPPEGRATAIRLLGGRGDSAAVDRIADFLGDGDKNVREAAIEAVGALGDGRHVPLLLKCVMDEATMERSLSSLARMAGRDIDGAIMARLGDGELSTAALKAVARRGCREAVPELLKLTNTGVGAVRGEAWSALGATASEPHMDGMMAAMLSIKDEDLKSVAADAVKSVCGRAADKQKCFEAVAKHYEKADEATQEFVIELASVAGGGKALELVRSAIKSGNRRLFEKALRSLCSWPDGQATGDLMEVARNAADEKTRIIALRGYITVAEREVNEKKRAKYYADICGLVKRPEDKNLLISKLRDTRDVAAVRLLGEYVGDAEVQKEACMAAVDLTRTMTKGGPREELKALMDKVIATCKDKGILNRATEARKGLGN